MAHNLNNNKLAAGILLAGVIAMVCGFAADGLYQENNPTKRGFAIEVAEAVVGGDAQAAEAQVDIGALLAAADAAKGKELAGKKCASCHNFESGPNKVGPTLAGTVGNKIGGHAGFTYSDALTKHGGNWGYEELNQWLKAPANFAKGNKMAFAGVKNDAERANIIAYLKSISPKAPAYPAPKAAAAPAAAPAKK